MPNPLRATDLFVGRQQLLAEVAELLDQGQSTLLLGGRRMGKTTLARELTSTLVGRTIVRTDAAGWGLKTEASALGALLSVVRGQRETEHSQATWDDIVEVLEQHRPLALVIDEADRILQPAWGPGFFTFLRWLDDTHLRSELAILLIGGPALVLFQDQEQGGSPPLNTAEQRYLESLDRDAVAELVHLAGGTVPTEEVMTLAGGHAWLTTRLLAEVWQGRSLDEAAEPIHERAASTFHSWQHQLGPRALEFLRTFPPQGLRPTDPNWASSRESARFARCVGVLRQEHGRLCRGPRIFFDWLDHQDPDAIRWDIAIAFAPQDEEKARTIRAHLPDDARTYFAPESTVDARRSDDQRLLPNLHGVASRLVLVISTAHYVANHWRHDEYLYLVSRGLRAHFVDLGRLPTSANGLAHYGTTPSELQRLAHTLRQELGYA
ncbi:AAA family ATPase [Phytohabitans houttuyneae]|uniref:ORC1/DEAH AAA+ ATPase domain-containing protein n=1 Tax=Phytohabitans houttuyneae TaxID=1076126 RepID=A0A6V8K4Q0_9ACTN|nr:ATP-binding protein [Phytohabitans houttuyneae]GFJ77371.1 hypothetical protein Phou_015510 [Phytohabitans houttuyneae]